MKNNFILLFCFIATLSSAQYAETMHTDRPGKSIRASTVGKKILQFQHGIGYQYQSFDFNTNNLIYQSRYSVNDIRYGISKRFEISALIGYAFFTYEDEHHSDQPVNFHTFRNIEVGGRYNILDGSKNGWVWGVQGRLLMTPIWVNQFPSIGFTTSLEKNLKNFMLTANLGYNQSEMYPDHLFYSLQLRVPLRSGMGFMLETFSHYTVSLYANNLLIPYFDAGFWYSINKDIQLDMQAVYSNVEFFDSFRITDWYLEAGISWRLNFKKE